MNMTILFVIMLDLIIVLSVMLAMYKIKNKLATSKLLPVVFWSVKLTVIIPMLIFTWLVYAYMYKVFYSIDYDIYYGVLIYFGGYLVLIVLCLYMQKNHRKVNLFLASTCFAFNIYCSYFIFKYHNYLIQFIPSDNSHNIYGAGSVIGHIYLVSIIILSILGVITSYIYSKYNVGELTS